MTDVDALHAAYRAARTEFSDAVRIVKDLRGRISKVGRSLQGNQEAGDPRPAWVPGTSDWVDALPERAELVAALDRYHAARQALVDGFHALPPEERSHVAQLPPYVEGGPGRH